MSAVKDPSPPTTEKKIHSLYARHFPKLNGSSSSGGFPPTDVRDEKNVNHAATDNLRHPPPNPNHAGKISTARRTTTRIQYIKRRQLISSSRGTQYKESQQRSQTQSPPSAPQRPQENIHRTRDTLLDLTAHSAGSHSQRQSHNAWNSQDGKTDARSVSCHSSANLHRRTAPGTPRGTPPHYHTECHPLQRAFRIFFSAFHPVVSSQSIGERRLKKERKPPWLRGNETEKDGCAGSDRWRARAANPHRQHW